MGNNKRTFPEDFFWGASTASHQVEGGTLNQWSIWELANAKELADTAEKRLNWLPGWKNIKAQAEDPNNYVSGQGVDHYRRYQEDFNLAKQLNLNAFRFGIEWARLEPAEGQWDEAEIEHYRLYIKELRARGLEPFLNLWHWTLPTWFSDKGGFSKKANISYFERFTQKVADNLLDDVTYVITLNEPNVYSSFSYLTGEWVPQQKKPFRFLATYWHLVKAHRASYKVLKAAKPSLQVGIAAQLGNARPKRPGNWADKLAAKFVRYFWNWWFLNRIRHQQDYIGFNYYFTDYYKGFKKLNPAKPLSDLGWYMEPGGIGGIIRQVWQHYHKPIIITENGLADAADAHRQWWIEETVKAMALALNDGVDLRGYMHWSLLDNFEWKYGWWPKFGLIEVDREHGMTRKIRPSAQAYSKIIKKIRL